MPPAKRLPKRSNGGKLTEGNGDTRAAQMLGAAATLFRTHGYAGTSTRDLAKVLGIQSASLYYHISKKEDLLCALSVDGLERLIDEVSRAIEGEHDPVERVRILVRVHITCTLADRDKYVAMLFELKSLTGQRRTRVIALRDAYQALAARTIARAQRAGALRRDVPAKLATLALLNLLNWTIFWYQPGRGAAPERLADVLSTIFLEGTLVKRPRSLSRTTQAVKR